MKTIISMTMMLAALATPGLSIAQETLPDVRVSYADLDLRTAAGGKALDRRLAKAVKQVCPNADGSADLMRKAVVRRCLAAKSAEVAQQRTRLLAEIALKGGLAARSIDK